MPSRLTVLCGVLLAACAAQTTESPGPAARHEAKDPRSTLEETSPAPRASQPDDGPSVATRSEEDPSNARPHNPVRTLSENALDFAGSCEPGSVVTIAAVGDLLLHGELQRQAYAAEDRYLNLWSSIVDLLGAADITYGNLEGPAAWGINRKEVEVPDPGLRFDNKVYSGYAKFNYHPSIAEDLVRTGFDVVSTANNHALDRGPLGIDRTLDALDAAKLKHTGTRRLGTQERWYTVTKAQGLSVAWIACTLHTNFGKDDADQVLDCFEPEQRVAQAVEQLARDPAIDAVIVTPHWGREYEVQPGARQIEIAQTWIDAGATAIIGSHSHVLSPWEKRKAADGREAFVIYSLGNFVSHQRTLNRCSTIILYLGLRKDADGVTRVVGARYVPLHVRMVGNKEKFFVEAVDRVDGPAEARKLVDALYGPDNLQDPNTALDLRDHCSVMAAN